MEGGNTLSHYYYWDSYLRQTIFLGISCWIYYRLIKVTLFRLFIICDGFKAETLVQTIVMERQSTENRMKAKTILCAVGLILLSGCTPKMNVNQPPMDEAAHEFHDLVEKTAMSEDKTVVWNGTTAMLADCDFDDGTTEEDKH